MTFRLEALPARKGDALLLRFGTASSPGLIVIDGGPAKVYAPQMKPAFKKIRDERHLTAGQPLPIDLLMVSHIDDDHMVGILELTKEMVEAVDDNQAPPYRIANVWHNTFDDVIGSTPEELEASIAAQFGAASTAEAVMGQWSTLEPEAALVLSSIPQGRQLRDDVARLNLPLNAAFDGKLIMLGTGKEKAVQFGKAAQSGVALRVIAPSKARLQTLQKKHDQYLKEKKLGKTSREAALAAFSDPSPTNLSSIVLEARSGGKSMLLTGDARGDDILEGLRVCKLLTTAEPYVVDVLKVPHHGSDNNVTQEFFEQVQASHYVFSGNGEHGNPERETLDMLFKARKSAGLEGNEFTVWLTYSVTDIDRGRAADWEKERLKGNKTRKWNAKKDSLEALFEDTDLDALGATIEDSGVVQIEP